MKSANARFILWLMAGGLALTVASASAQTGGYMKVTLSGPRVIEGESRDAAHKDWIEIESLSAVAARSAAGTAASVRPPAAAQAQAKTFRVVKRTDKASPRLARAVVTGEHLSQVVIEIYSSAGGAPKLTERLTLDNAVIASLRRQSGGMVPSEEITFSCERFTQQEFPGTKPAALPPGAVKPKP